jgi:hypothetical protein
MAKYIHCVVKLRVIQVYLYYVFLTTTITRWNFNGFYSGFVIMKPKLDQEIGAQL